MRPNLIPLAIALVLPSLVLAKISEGEKVNNIIVIMIQCAFFASFSLRPGAIAKILGQQASILKRLETIFRQD